MYWGRLVGFYYGISPNNQKISIGLAPLSLYWGSCIGKLLEMLLDPKPNRA